MNSDLIYMYVSYVWLPPPPPSVFVEDTRYCQIRLGDQKERTEHTQGSGPWQDTCSFLVHNIKTDKVGHLKSVPEIEFFLFIFFFLGGGGSISQKRESTVCKTWFPHGIAFSVTSTSWEGAFSSGIKGILILNVCFKFLSSETLVW